MFKHNYYLRIILYFWKYFIGHKAMKQIMYALRYYCDLHCLLNMHNVLLSCQNVHKMYKCLSTPGCSFKISRTLMRTIFVQMENNNNLYSECPCQHWFFLHKKKRVWTVKLHVMQLSVFSFVHISFLLLLLLFENVLRISWQHRVYGLMW